MSQQALVNQYHGTRLVTLTDAGSGAEGGFDWTALDSSLFRIGSDHYG